MSGPLLSVEVGYALPARQTLIALQVPAGTTAREAVIRSGLAERHPELNLRECPIGVFGKEVADDRELSDGDRVEIYRPLANEPRAARREKAARGGTMGNKS